STLFRAPQQRRWRDIRVRPRRRVVSGSCSLDGIQIIDELPQPAVVLAVELEDQTVQVRQRRFVALDWERFAEAERAAADDVFELAADLFELLLRRLSVQADDQ